jgi:hypothetical protein
MPQRVFLHVGSPKTGTTFLQHVLWSHRQLALKQGVLLPLNTLGHYLACLDVRDEHQAGARVPGAWRALVDAALDWDGDVLVSHELFAPASREQARTAVADFGDAEVHVIVTARDLARQIPAHWQENIKGLVRQSAGQLRGGVKVAFDEPFPDFMDDLRSDTARTSWFWTVQDFAEVVARWGGGLPRGHVHVVTVPPAGTPPTVLWERFAALIGLAPEMFDVTSARTNNSLGAEQVELLRRVNAVLGDRLVHGGPYSAMVKEYFANEVLAGQQGTAFALTGADHAFAVSESEVVVEKLRRSGVDVVGDLAELVPVPDDAGRVSAREKPEDDRVLVSSILALITILDRVRRQSDGNRETVFRLRRELEHARRSQAALQAELSVLRGRRRPARRWPGALA